MSDYPFRVQVEPKDVDAAVRKTIVECAMDKQGKHRVACAQGAMDFGYVAHRKYESFFGTLDEVNQVYWRVQRLCSRKFGPWGSPLTDSCDIGAYRVRDLVEGIGEGRLKRRTAMEGRRRKR